MDKSILMGWIKRIEESPFLRPMEKSIVKAEYQHFINGEKNELIDYVKKFNEYHNQRYIIAKKKTIEDRKNYNDRLYLYISDKNINQLEKEIIENEKQVKKIRDRNSRFNLGNRKHYLTGYCGYQGGQERLLTRGDFLADCIKFIELKDEDSPHCRRAKKELIIKYLYKIISREKNKQHYSAPKRRVK